MSEPQPVRIGLKAIGPFFETEVWVLASGSVFLIAYLAYRLQPGGGALASLVVLGCLFAAQDVLLLSLRRRLGQDAYLELRQGAATLVMPAYLREPLALHRDDVASYAVFADKGEARAARLPDQLAGPVLNFAYFAGRRDAMILFSRLVPLSRTRLQAGRGVSNRRGLRREGSPAAGLLLALADPASAEEALRSWIPIFSEPVRAEPGTTPSGAHDEAAVRRQRRIVGVSAVGFALLLVLVDSKHRHLETALQSVVASTGLLFVLRLVLRRIADSRYARVGIASATCAILVTIGSLLRSPWTWLLVGLTSAAVGAVMMLGIDAQNGLLKGLRRRDGP